MCRPTIRVIESRRYRNPQTGATASLYGAYPGDGYVLETVGYTWQLTDSRGASTSGLCRRPVKTFTEAEDVAIDYAQRCGAVYVK